MTDKNDAMAALETLIGYAETCTSFLHDAGYEGKSQSLGLKCIAARKALEAQDCKPTAKDRLDQIQKELENRGYQDVKFHIVNAEDKTLEDLGHEAADFLQAILDGKHKPAPRLGDSQNGDKKDVDVEGLIENYSFMVYPKAVNLDSDTGFAKAMRTMSSRGYLSTPPKIVDFDELKVAWENSDASRDMSLFQFFKANFKGKTITIADKES